MVNHKQLQGPEMLLMDKNVTESITDSIDKTILRAGKFLLIGGAVAVAYFGGRALITDARQNSVSNDYGDGTQNGFAAQYAVEMYAAFHPLATWVWDGTDEDALFAIARKMRQNKVSFDAVATQYRRQFSRNLIDDLQNELDAEDLDKFNQIKNGTIAGLSAVVTSYLARVNTPVYNQQMQIVDYIKSKSIITNITQRLKLPNGDYLLTFTPTGTNYTLFIHQKNLTPYA